MSKQKVKQTNCVKSSTQWAAVRTHIFDTILASHMRTPFLSLNDAWFTVTELILLLLTFFLYTHHLGKLALLGVRVLRVFLILVICVVVFQVRGVGGCRVTF